MYTIQKLNKWIVSFIFLLVLPVYECTNYNERSRGDDNNNSVFIELALVVSKEVYEGLDNDMGKVLNICNNIVNMVNSLYSPVNITVALVDVVIWTDYNLIEMSENNTEMLHDFLKYRKEYLVSKQHNDCAFLLVEKLIDNVLGLSIPDSICSYDYSGGVILFSSEIQLVAMIIAHEIAHTLGVVHDTPECECTAHSCIMTDGLDSTVPVIWSSCSIDQINLAFSRGMDYCFRDMPIPLTTQCGNGFVESGEQCDCGLDGYCKNYCCNPTTCMLQPNASCATGQCCNLSTCQPHKIGKECRKSYSECDLPEFCSGESEYCPDDSFKRNTELCNHGNSYCYQGACHSHNDQCKLLWGLSGHSFSGCYEQNLRGTRGGDCGYSRINNTYKTCTRQNKNCGRLQCTHWSRQLQYGWDNNAIFSQSGVNYRSSEVTCQTVSIDMGLQDVDPGMTPDGAKCGEDRICIRQNCISVKEFRSLHFFVDCPDNCSGHGTCDNVGQCHCDVGFEPHSCATPVQQDTPLQKRDGAALHIIMCFFLPGLLPLLLLASFFVYAWKCDSNSNATAVNHEENSPVEQLSAPAILETEL